MNNALAIIAPLDEIHLPLHVDGTRGSNRAITAVCQIKAGNDIEAITAWLKEYQKSDATYRAYRKEAERLLLWSVNERQKAISSLSSDDLLAYSHFLENPQPHDVWCGPKLARKGKRWSLGWKPFVGPLSESAKKTALHSLKSLFTYLQEVQYLQHNPMLPIKRQIQQHRTKEDRQKKVQERVVEAIGWNTLLDVIEAYPDTNEKSAYLKTKLRFMFAVFYGGALRISELATHHMKAFCKIYDYEDEKEVWFLEVVGKGNKLRQIPIPDFVMKALIDYRRTRQLPDYPQPNEMIPIIESARTGKAISTRRINQLIKDVAYKAAAKFEVSQPELSQKLKKFSAHWIRHTACTYHGREGISIHHRKENLGHSSTQTTEIYDHSLLIERHRAVKNLNLRPTFAKRMIEKAR